MQNDEKDEDNIDDHDDDHEITCNIEEKYLNLWSLVPCHLLHKRPDWGQMSNIKISTEMQLLRCENNFCVYSI